jgi:hypothetical protein
MTSMHGCRIPDPVRERELSPAGATAGALLLAQPVGWPGDLLRARHEQVARRCSPLLPNTRLAHGDLHNHSLLSDGQGDPEQAFDLMRAAGLDVAALTDHSTLSYGQCAQLCSGDRDCQRLEGLYERSWRRTIELADKALEDGQFVALRGFEWTSPTLGHINVWFSKRWIDPLHTAGTAGGAGAEQFVGDIQDLDPSGAGALNALLLAAPTTSHELTPFYDWLRSPPDVPRLGGGLDGLAGFNHPGREAQRFASFAYEAALRERVVSLEVFNRGDDYLFEGTERGEESPINQCLNRGWRVGLAGVSDEHSRNYGLEGRGRIGLWVNSLSRAGVREALESRRFFATRLSGLRLAATANGVPMGGSLPHRRGSIDFQLDISRGRSWSGRRLNVQVLQSGEQLPRIVEAREVTVPLDETDTIALRVAIDADQGRWVVLRVTDPSQPADGRARGVYRELGNAVAYASPFFLEPNEPDFEGGNWPS